MKTVSKKEMSECWGGQRGGVGWARPYSPLEGPPPRPGLGPGPGPGPGGGGGGEVGAGRRMGGGGDGGGPGFAGGVVQS